jgi:hypothetical protein
LILAAGGNIDPVSGTGRYPGAAGYGAAPAPCGGGGGGFYGAGGDDQNSFAGGQGFRQGGAGGLPPFVYSAKYLCMLVYVPRLLLLVATNTLLLYVILCPNKV